MMDALTESPRHPREFDAPTRPTTTADEVEALSRALERALDERRRAECMAHIQSDAVQLALDLLVTGKDLDGYFKAFIKSLVDNCESHACGVWLLDDEGTCCDMWMAYIDGRFHTRDSEGWGELALPRVAMAAHLQAFTPGWRTTIEYVGDDARLPEAVRAFNADAGVLSMLVAPLVLGPATLGWIALATGCASDCADWRHAVIDATARQATLALHQSRQAEQNRLEARRQAMLEERNRIARDIHDTLTQGFAAILMQLQAAQRAAPGLPAQVTHSLETAVDLARSHMIEARRSVGTLRPRAANEEDLSAGLVRLVTLVRRTTSTPVELDVPPDLPSMGGLEREVLGIVQEALTNAVRHARASRIVVQASAVRGLGLRVSVADDGQGLTDADCGRGFGMTSMQERADRIGAALTVVTAPDAGTEVVLAWEPPAFSIPNS